MTIAQRPFHRVLNATPLLLTLLVSACGTQYKPLPGPVDFRRSEKPEGSLGTGGGATAPTSTTIRSLPSPPVSRKELARPEQSAVQAGALIDGEEEVSMAIEQTPLPMFIQILYGNVLKRTFSLDPAVTSRTDPVTFKTSRPISKARMQQIVANLLRTYGLVVVDLDGLVRITPEAGASNPTMRVQMGKTLPEGSDPLRPSYQYVELDTVRTAEMVQWLRQILGTRVILQEDTSRNGFLLSGTQGDIKAALDLIQSFDQPRMRGRIARRIMPAYASASDLGTRLVEVLTAQGYSVSNSGSTGSSAIVVMSVPSISSILVFTNSTTVMEHIEKWAKELDRPPTGISSNALFTYPVKFADAQELAKTLGELLGGAGSAPPPAAAGGTQAAQRTSFGRVVVNNATNTLIFKGSSAEEQQQIKDLLRDLDRPTKSAMIEVVVAEVQRGALESLGVQWTFNNTGVASDRVRSGSLGGTGFNISAVNSARQIMGALNALATNSQARILSNPKVLARNGETATIQVGNEVPIITSQQSTTSGSFTGGSNQTGVIQQVQYRSTGVILRVRPVINSGNRLDLDVSQEVSSAASTQTGVSASPTISTRRIETKLSLRDGSTILLGGLISRDDSDSDSGVPLLKDIPGLGALFRSRTDTTKQTELLIMITPYVINDDFEAEEITQAMQNTFGDWAKDLKTSRVAREPGIATPGSQGADIQPPNPPASELKSRADNPANIEPDPAQPVIPVPAPTGTSKSMSLGTGDDGVVTSRPVGVPPPEPQRGSNVVSPASEPNTPTDQAATAGKPTAPGSLPGGIKGQVVTDPKVLEEVQKLFKPK